MTVKIVTDSVADLPSEVVEELGITVVPLNVRFGTDVYREGIDITADQFYEKLKQSKILPITSVPAPAAFTQVYNRLAEETNEILAITLTSRLSGTYEVAVQSSKLVTRKCQIEVIDSKWAASAEGLIVITAARAAQTGASLSDIRATVRSSISRVELRGAFDTLEYLKRGGRIGKAQALLGSMLKINPIIGVKDGEVFPFGREHSRAKALDHLYNFAIRYRNIEKLAVEYATALDDANELLERLSTRFPKEHILRSRVSPVIGTHTGPGLIVVSVLGDR
jgi:DegV family protein with EDD domain